MNQGTPGKIENNANSQVYEYQTTDRYTLTDSSKKMNFNSKNHFLSPKEISSVAQSLKSPESSLKGSDRRHVTPNQPRNSSLSQRSHGKFKVLEASPTLVNNKDGLITTFLEENEMGNFGSPKNSQNGYYKIEDAEELRKKISQSNVTPVRESKPDSLKIDYSSDSYSVNQEREYKAYNGGVVNFFDAEDTSCYYERQNEQIEKRIEQDQIYTVIQEDEEEMMHDDHFYQNQEHYEEDYDGHFQYDQTNYEEDEEFLNQPGYQNILNKIRNNFLYNFGGGKILSPVTEQRSMEDKYDSTGYIFHSKLSSSLKEFHNNLPTNHLLSSKYSVSHDRAGLGSLDQKQALFLLTSLNKSNINRRMTFDTYDNIRDSVGGDNEGNKTSRSHKMMNDPQPKSIRMKKKGKISNLNVRNNVPDLTSFGIEEEAIDAEITPVKTTGPQAPSMIETNTLDSTYEYECDILPQKSVSKLIGHIVIEDVTHIKQDFDKSLIEIRNTNKSISPYQNNSQSKKRYFGRKKFDPDNFCENKSYKKSPILEDSFYEEHIQGSSTLRSKENQENYFDGHESHRSRGRGYDVQGNQQGKNCNIVENVKNFDLLHHSNNHSRNHSLEKRGSGKKLVLEYNDSMIKNMRSLDSISPVDSGKSKTRIRDDSLNDLSQTIKNGFPGKENSQKRRVNFYDYKNQSSEDLNQTTMFADDNDDYESEADGEFFLSDLNHTPIKKSFNHNMPQKSFIEQEVRQVRGSNLEKAYNSLSDRSNGVEGETKEEPRARQRTPMIKKLFKRRSRSPMKLRDISSERNYIKYLSKKNSKITSRADSEVKNLSARSPEVSHVWGEDLNENFDDSVESSERYRKTIEKYNFNSKDRNERNSVSRSSSEKSRQLRPESITRINSVMKNEECEGYESQNVVEDYASSVNIGNSLHNSSSNNMIKTFRDNVKPFVNDLMNSTTTPRSKMQPYVQEKKKSNMKVAKPEPEQPSQLNSCESRKNIPDDIKASLQSLISTQHQNSRFSPKRNIDNGDSSDNEGSSSQRRVIKCSQIQSELAESIYGKPDLNCLKQPSVVIAIDDAEEKSPNVFQQSDKIVIDSGDYDKTRKINMGDPDAGIHSTLKNLIEAPLSCSSVNQSQESKDDSLRSITDTKFLNELNSHQISHLNSKDISQIQSINTTCSRIKPMKKIEMKMQEPVNSKIINLTTTPKMEQPKVILAKRTHERSQGQYLLASVSRNLTPVIQPRRNMNQSKYKYVVSKRSVTPIRKEVNLKTSLNDQFSSVKNAISYPSNAYESQRRRDLRYLTNGIMATTAGNYKSVAVSKPTPKLNLKGLNQSKISNSSKNIHQQNMVVNPAAYSSLMTSKRKPAQKIKITSRNVTQNSVSEMNKGPKQLSSLTKCRASKPKRLVIDTRKPDTRNYQSNKVKTSRLSLNNKNYRSRNNIRNSSQGNLKISRRSVEPVLSRRRPTKSQMPLGRRKRISYNPLMRQNRLTEMSVEKRRMRSVQKEQSVDIKMKQHTIVQVKGSLFESAFNISNIRKVIPPNRSLRENSVQRTRVERPKIVSVEKRKKVSYLTNLGNKENHKSFKNSVNRRAATSSNVNIHEPFAQEKTTSRRKAFRHSVQNNLNHASSSREPRRRNILNSRLKFGNRAGTDSAVSIEKKTPYAFQTESRLNYFRRKKNMV